MIIDDMHTRLMREENVVDDDRETLELRLAVLFTVIVFTVALGFGSMTFALSQNPDVRSRLTLDRVDPCNPHLLGSQLSSNDQMVLEERCAHQQSAVPAD